jgi:predicted nucleotidyltransferase component of viral defense system
VSIQVRLARHARELGLDPNLVLTRFAAERFLYRLSRSPFAERFVLKGALLMLVWLGETVRPTRDADLLGFGEITEQSLGQIVADVCRLEVEPDGLEFLLSSIHVAAIRAEDTYGGLRATLEARLGKARLRVQLDVGVGDAVSPAPEWLEYPALLDFPRPRLRAYRPETAIAEKLHAMVVLGEANSRMRDFFDIHALAQRARFEGDVLARALRATFERRRTAIPADPPIALTTAFAEVEGKRAQWAGFIRRNRLAAAPAELVAVIDGIAGFVVPVLAAAARGEVFAGRWPPGGPWEASS